MNARGGRAGHAAALGTVVLAAAVAGMLLHRTGHTQGDDFALYLRQARSVFDGDIAAVVADNRFAVLYSDNSFSPIAYPWGWPLLLAPFVHLWGLDYDRLKVLEVALMIGAGLLVRWLLLYAFEADYQSRVPSLIAGIGLMLLAMQVWSVAFLADLQSSNRRMLAELRLRSKQQEYADEGSPSTP